ncbi:MAG: hypothetical protein H7Y59_04450 [Anaerolineales bacterium]|nr:hypothetical protein [Anaerolineales bacterium]
MKLQKNILLMSALILSIILSACGPSEAELTPTLSVEDVQTMVVSTLASGMTQTAIAAPTKTITPTITLVPTLASPTLGALVTPFGTTVGTGGGGTVTSCYAMSFVSDVTIPDNTAMTQGQAFTKTWKVRNSGTCAWDAGFKFAFTSGDAMSGATFTLTQAVAANAETSLSINMTAPSKAGSIKSSWRMSTAAGQFFGDEVYVLVVVGGGAAASTATTGAPTATATTGVVVPTATTAPTATATP